jgi:hypothetical protein
MKLGIETGERLLTVVGSVLSLNHPSILAYDTLRLARVMKIVDTNVMAYEMMMQDTRTTATGSRIPAEYDNIQVFMQALGFTPNQAIDAGLAGNMVYDLKDRKMTAIEQSKRMFTKSLDLWAKGDLSGAEHFLLEGSAIIDAYGFGEAHRDEVFNSSFGKTGMERLEFMVHELLKAGIVPPPSLMEGLR